MSALMTVRLGLAQDRSHHLWDFVSPTGDRRGTATHVSTNLARGGCTIELIDDQVGVLKGRLVYDKRARAFVYSDVADNVLLVIKKGERELFRGKTTSVIYESSGRRCGTFVTQFHRLTQFLPTMFMRLSGAATVEEEVVSQFELRGTWTGLQGHLQLRGPLTQNGLLASVLTVVICGVRSVGSDDRTI
jgi:hypothetical protein